MGTGTAVQRIFVNTLNMFGLTGLTLLIFIIPCIRCYVLQYKDTGQASCAFQRNNITLPVVYLQTYEWDHYEAETLLFCSIRRILQHIGSHTPLSIYIFHRIKLTEKALSTASTLSNSTHINFVKISRENWKLSELEASKRNKWRGRDWDEDYRLMGKWRLEFPFKYLRRCGHRHLLFVDADSFVDGDVARNLIDMFDEDGLYLAYRALQSDPPFVADGLAELARYFIKSNEIKPSPLLFAQCSPQSIDGLHSRGWSREVMHGNFVIISFEFWFTPLVQQFIGLCLASGDVVVHRWQEQLPIGMARLIFCPPEKQRDLDFAYAHGRGRKSEKLREKCASQEGAGKDTNMEQFRV